MQNQNGSTGHNGHMSQADIDELHLILESYAAGLISVQEFTERHAKLIERYGKEIIAEAIDRYRSEQDKEEEHFYRQVNSSDFPADANKKMFYGITGEITKLICDGTENKPEAVAAQFLCMFGNGIGHAPFITQDKDHGTNINAAIVGPTAGGAKGSSLNATKRVFKVAWAEYLASNFSGGHNSSEAIIAEISNPVYGIDESGEEVLKEPRNTDKRLLIVEEELTRVFNASGRGGSNISETLRECYDRPDKIRAKSRQARLESTNPHVSVIGHVTPEGLRASLKTVELFNGFANRFIYIASQRTRPVPRPPVVDWSTGRPAQIAVHLRSIGLRFHPVKASNECPPVEFTYTPEAEAKWDEIYYKLESEYSGKSGLHGAIVARWKPAILRLALIYAALDLDTNEKGPVIDVQHLEAAEALWQYSAASAIWAFGATSGNPEADTIAKHLKRKAAPVSKTEIRMECFNNHIPTAKLNEALAFLNNSGLARRAKGAGQRWEAC